MRFTLVLLLGFTVSLALCIGSPLSKASEEPCSVEHEKWSGSSGELKDALEQLRQIKDESMSPEITESLSKGSKSLSIARIVQSALQRRSERLAEARGRCREFADKEKYAFDNLKRCLSGPSLRRNNAAVAALSSISRDRERLLKQMQDLMLDEAYVQYKGEREYPSGAYSDYSQDQAPRMTYQRQWGPDPRMDPRSPGAYRNPQIPYGYYSR